MENNVLCFPCPRRAMRSHLFRWDRFVMINDINSPPFPSLPTPFLSFPVIYSTLTTSYTKIVWFLMFTLSTANKMSYLKSLFRWDRFAMIYDEGTLHNLPLHTLLFLSSSPTSRNFQSFSSPYISHNILYLPCP